MNDIENYVINAMTTAYGNTATVLSQYINDSSAFPCVGVIQLEESAYRYTYDEQLAPHHKEITFQIEFYSNLSIGARTQIKSLADTANTVMENMKFTLLDFQIVPNIDRSFTRGVARYAAIVGEPKTINGNTVYQIYRK